MMRLVNTDFTLLANKWPRCSFFRKHFALMLRRPLFMLLLLPVIAQAQPQLQNASFETWTNAGAATQEPTDWSSLKTSDGGAILNGLVPQLCWRSDDAHTGNYSVNLRTVSSVAGDANGLLTNGRVHAEFNIANSYMFTDQGDAQWNTPMGGSRPDSLVGWYKAAPEPGDRSNIGALLHVDEGRLPAFGTEANWVGGASWKAPSAQVGQWTRFSSPFQYSSGAAPEWVLLILTAGDSAGSQVGTQVWFDDLALIYDVLPQPEVDVVQLNGSDPFVLDVTYSTGGIPVVGTTFTVELSDASGSFVVPQVLGTLLSDQPSGTIACDLPGGIPAGEYLLRVTTPSPYYAPVAVPITIVGATATSDIATSSTYRCWSVPGHIAIDVPSGASELATYELFDVQGRSLSAGPLRSSAVVLVPHAVEQGLVLVRINTTTGVSAKRLLVR